MRGDTAQLAGAHERGYVSTPRCVVHASSCASLLPTTTRTTRVRARLRAYPAFTGALLSSAGHRSAPRQTRGVPHDPRRTRVGELEANATVGARPQLDVQQHSGHARTQDARPGGGGGGGNEEGAGDDIPDDATPRVPDCVEDLVKPFATVLENSAMLLSPHILLDSGAKRMPQNLALQAMETLNLRAKALRDASGACLQALMVCYIPRTGSPAERGAHLAQACFYDSGLCGGSSSTGEALPLPGVHAMHQLETEVGRELIYMRLGCERTEMLDYRKDKRKKTRTEAPREPGDVTTRRTKVDWMWSNKDCAGARETTPLTLTKALLQDSVRIVHNEYLRESGWTTCAFLLKPGKPRERVRVEHRFSSDIDQAVCTELGDCTWDLWFGSAPDGESSFGVQFTRWQVRML